MLNQTSAQRQSFLPRGIPGGGIRKPFPGEGRRPGQRPLGGPATNQHQNFLAKHGLTPETRGTGAQARFLASQAGSRGQGGNRPLRWQAQGGAGGGSGTTAPAAIPAPNVAMPSAGMPVPTAYQTPAVPPQSWDAGPNTGIKPAPNVAMPTPGQPAPPPGSQPPKSSASPPLIPGPGMSEHAGSAPIFSQPAPPALGEYQQPTQKRAQLAALRPGQSNSNMGVGY